MKKSHILLWSLLVLALVGGAIQLFPMSRTNPPVTADLNAPAEVKAVLKASCYDCHSNETVWLWYTKVAPASWLIAHDVSDGRRHFNFSDWNSYAPGRQAAIKGRTIREIQRGKMPPWYYTIKHPDAKLTADKQALLEAWATGR